MVPPDLRPPPQNRGLILVALNKRKWANFVTHNLSSGVTGITFSQEGSVLTLRCAST